MKRTNLPQFNSGDVVFASDIDDDNGQVVGISTMLLDLEFDSVVIRVLARNPSEFYINHTIREQL